MRAALGLAVLGLAACGEREAGVSVEVAAHITALSVSPGVAIEEAKLLIASITLVPCESSAARLWRALSPISTAWAHGAHAPGAGEQFTVSLAGEAHQVLGTLLPAAGRYCEAELTVAPVSTHVSLRVAGEWGFAGERAAFEITTAAERRVRIPIALHLDDAQRTATLLLGFGPAALPADLHSTSAGVELLDAVVASVRAR